MNILTLDFETFFDKDYTLSKLTTEAYIRDPRFEALGCGFRSTSEPVKNFGHSWWAGKDKLEKQFSYIDWPNTAVLCHHAHFDGLILSHHFGVKPAFWLDTLSMGRKIYGNSISLGLGSLARFFELDPKNVPYDLFRGRHWHELDAQTQKQVADGCLHDVSLTWDIFQKMLKGFPEEELRVIDQTIRFFTEPQLVGDIPLLEQVRQSEWDNKNTRLLALEVTSTQLASADQFKKLLEAEGVDVEMKAGKNGPIPALASTDQFMRDLEIHDNERVAQLALARLEVKSTIDETRSARLGAMASRGPLCVYLSYCGAQTLRWSGGDKVNFQNFRRGSDIRRSLCAPKGCAVGVVDLSQIECRVLNYVAGQWDIIDKFKRKEDPYIGGASLFYQTEVRKPSKDMDPETYKFHDERRGTGKQMELSCGYGSGALTFQKTAKRGTYGPPIDLELEEAQSAVNVYRSTHRQITEKKTGYWAQGDDMLNRMCSFHAETIEWGPLVVECKGAGSRIIVPNGAWMNYNIEWDSENRCYQRKTRAGWRNIWGGVVAQNICEALSRLILSQAMLRIAKAGVTVLGCTHDELFFMTKEAWIAQAYAYAVDELTKDVSWLPGIPLEAEGSYGERYSK